MFQLVRITKEGFSNFIRNGWLSVASITIMVLTLLTMSLFIIINMVLNTGIKTIQDKIDISVYLKDTTKQEQVIDIQNDLSKMSNVKTIKYVSKNEALATYKTQNANNPILLESLSNQDGNPLPASLDIKVYDPSKLNDLTGYFNRDQIKPMVEKVSYEDNKAVIDRLFKATQFTKEIGLIATIAFTATSLVIIFNTVRMAIFTRREEIEIMKLVGATPGYIKAPFLIEGAVYGIVSTVISMLILSSILYFSAPAMVKYFNGVGNGVSDFLRQNFLLIFAAQILVGIAIGVISSMLAIRKHLQKV